MNSDKNTLKYCRDANNKMSTVRRVDINEIPKSYGNIKIISNSNINKLYGKSSRSVSFGKNEVKYVTKTNNK